MRNAIFQAFLGVRLRTSSRSSLAASGNCHRQLEVLLTLSSCTIRYKRILSIYFVPVQNLLLLNSNFPHHFGVLNLEKPIL
jgi:uncharacterized alpha-E superfamily protein